jgi:hypothetical protein
MSFVIFTGYVLDILTPRYIHLVDIHKMSAVISCRDAVYVATAGHLDVHIISIRCIWIYSGCATMSEENLSWISTGDFCAIRDI